MPPEVLFLIAGSLGSAYLRGRVNRLLLFQNWYVFNLSAFHSNADKFFCTRAARNLDPSYGGTDRAMGLALSLSFCNGDGNGGGQFGLWS